MSFVTETITVSLQALKHSSITASHFDLFSPVSFKLNGKIHTGHQSGIPDPMQQV